MNVFNMISSFFDNESYRKNPLPQNLSKDQFAAINIGAINAEQTEYYCDSLSTGSSVEDIKEYISNLQESLGDLIGYDFIKLKQPADLYQQSIAAWDMGRLVLVTRCCFDAGYISDEEAWHYIFNARHLSQESYISWEDFASGYVIGRAMWSGNTMSLIGIIAITQGLLKDEESPWKQCAF